MKEPLVSEKIMRMALQSGLENMILNALKREDLAGVFGFLVVGMGDPVKNNAVFRTFTPHSPIIK